MISELRKDLEPISLGALRAQTRERRDHRRRGDAAVAGSSFLAQSRFGRVEVELAFGDDAQADGARLNRSKGFGNPLVVGAVRPATDWILRPTVGALESGVDQELPEP